MSSCSITHHARLATVADVLELVRLRSLMFESMGVESTADWHGAARDRITEGLGDGSLLAAVVDSPLPAGGLASSGIAVIVEQMPGPTHPTGIEARISSMCTDPGHRRQGLAAAVLDRLLAELHDRGIQRIELHATPEGRPLYASRGFGPRPGGDEMRLSSSIGEVSRKADAHRDTR